MMIFALASAAASLVAAAQPGTVARPLESLFISTCFDGQVTLKEGDARKVDFASLPADLRGKLGSPARADVWQLSGPGSVYLYNLKFDAPGLSPHVCGIAANSMQFRPAVGTLAAFLNSSDDAEDESMSREWWRPQDGYVAVASRVSDYTVLQVNQLSEAQRRNVPQAR